MRKLTLVFFAIILITICAVALWQSVGARTRPAPSPIVASATASPTNQPTPASQPTGLPTATAHTPAAVLPNATASVAAPTATTIPTQNNAPAALLAMLQAAPRAAARSGPLARRFKQAPAQAATPVSRASQAAGSKSIFWATDMASMEHYTVTATLLYASAHLYMYVDDKIGSVSVAQVKSSADAFEANIYPTTRRFFGDKWSPGLDGDEHISVLHITRLGATGAFSAADEESVIGNPYSNGRHMIYMNVRDIQPGTASYNAVLAHEYQHAIHFFQDANEDSWVNEGASVLSEKLNGFGSGERAVLAFRQSPATQLTTWGDTPNRGAHYSASFAFLDYFQQRYGDQALLWLIADPANGAAGFDSVLQRLGKSERFDAVFADWTVANALGDTSVSDGRYGYSNGSLRLPANETATTAASRSITYPQYAAYYVELPALPYTTTFFFSGEVRTQLVPSAAHSGAFQWWSNRGDMMDSTLTRAYDLSALSSATLTYWVWYDLEEDWDYAYIAASTDDGRTWATLPTAHTTDTNPVGNNLGHGYTGKSGGGDTAVWVAESVDLTPYAGKKTLIRFEYVTDDAVTNAGFCVDDIAIPELGSADDAESDTGWQSQGFIRSSNIITQTFALRLITFGTPTRVETIPVDDAGNAHIEVAPAQRAILAIAGTAPITTEPATFQYVLRNQ